MPFKPFGKKYAFDKSVLEENFPSYLLQPVCNWIHDLMRMEGLFSGSLYDRREFIDRDFRYDLQLRLHETFPGEWSDFKAFISVDKDRLCNCLAYLLQRYCDIVSAEQLQAILKLGSSAYTVEKVKKNATAYERGGVYDLAWYVPDAVRKEAEEALSTNDMLLRAWNECYKLKPNLRDCVSQCNDFLEGFLRDKYWPTEQRTPSLSVCISRLEKDPSIFKFKGDTFNTDKVGLLRLLSGISQIRGEHQTGTGRVPTQEEAEYVLHTTIYIWNLIKDA